MLDAQEYLHLAIKASQAKEHFAALDYLHKSIDLSPDNANSYFLLAAEHAEIGLFDRAIVEMQKAIELEPTLYIARFQLSLLLIQAQQEPEAQHQLQVIIENSQDEPLIHFSRGLLALTNDQAFVDARAELQKGLELNTQNPGLNSCITSILESLDRSNPPPEQPTETKADSDYGSVLRVYKTDTFEEEN